MLKALTDLTDAIGGMFPSLGRARPATSKVSPAPIAVDAASPAPSEPAVAAQPLLDLALVMRDLYWPEAGFADSRAHSLAGAALARIFPHHVTTVERCPCEGGPERASDEPKCSECASDADTARLDAKLAAYLADIPRPAVELPVTITMTVTERAR